MGYVPRHPRRRKGHACPVCVAHLEVTLGIRPPPRPPAGPGGGSPRPKG